MTKPDHDHGTVLAALAQAAMFSWLIDTTEGDALRETVHNARMALDRLRDRAINLSALRTLDEALNSGDGSYKP